MLTLNLSGFMIGDNLNLSVSQEALTAGPVNVPAWGGGGGGGAITVNAVHRSLRQMAPDSIRFEVDLSSATFDTAGPVGDEVYNARLHDLIYLWDMGDPGTWTAPENVLPAWKNRNVAKGPSVAHVYRNHGDYTVSVLVIEPSSGKTATAETMVTVSDPQDFYGDSNTIYVNNVGDNDFSDVPAGVPPANKVNIDSLMKKFDGPTDATWASFEGGHAKRWRFKRGGSWEIAIMLDNLDTPDVMFDDYGDPLDPDPIWNIADTPASNELYLLRVGYNHDNQSIPGRTPQSNPPELRIRNIDGRGHFNSVTTRATDPASERSRFAWVVSAIELVMVDCLMDGFGQGPFDFQLGVGDYTTVGKVHLDNTSITNFGGQYPIIFSDTASVDSSFVCTGVKWEQPGDAVSSSPTHIGSRSPARITSPQFVHLRGCDSFITDGDLGHFQILKGARDDGYLVNVHSCSAEGGSEYVGTDGSYQATPQQRSHVHNMIFDGIIYVGGWSATSMFGLWGTGVTMRNCLYIVPAITRISNGCNGFITVTERNNTGNPLPDFVAEAPVRLYNSTLLVLRTAVQNAPSGLSVPSMIYGTHPNFTAVSAVNNVDHMPNLIPTGQSTPPNILFAPVSENVLWTPRCLGRRNPDDFSLDETRATPVDSIKDTKPLPGSAALGAATTGNVSYTDILGTTRAAPADKGAWEVA